MHPKTARAFAKREDYNNSPRLCRGCEAPLYIRPTDKICEMVRRIYCSRSCATKHTNVNQPRIKPFKIRICRDCGAEFVNHGSFLGKIVCYTCWLLDKTKLERKTKAESNHREIRAHARQLLPPRGGRCVVCSYDKFVEICHIRPVADFPDSATLFEINAPDNLIRLCPNHHWELDHGDLDGASLKGFAVWLEPEADRHRFRGVRGSKPTKLLPGQQPPILTDTRRRRRDQRRTKAI